MPGNIALQNELQRIQRATIHEFEEELKCFKEQRQRDDEEAQERARRFHGMLREAIRETGLDIEIFGRLSAYHDNEAQRLEEFLAQIRDDHPTEDPQLLAKAHRMWVSEQTRLHRANGIRIAQCVDAFVVADGQDLEELKATNSFQPPRPGVKQNPFVNAIDPRWLKLKASHTGSGSGMGAYGATAPVWGFFNFLYLPPVDTGIVNATLTMFYTGFWLVKANDGCWDNKDAAANVDVWLRWHQGAYVSNWKKLPFMFAAGDNIYFYRVHHGETDTYSWQIGPLLGGHNVWLEVAVGLHVDARGGGSHAEINYADGAGSNVWAMSMFIG